MKHNKVSTTERLTDSHFWPYYMLGIAVISSIIAVVSLRQNNYTMIRLRDTVTKVDQADGDVEAALRELREYVYGHMNTNLASGNNAIKPPIQLKYRYERLAATEADRVKAQNAQVTAAGEAKCAAQYPAGGYNAPRVACVQEYVRQNAVSSNSVPDGLYKFDFVSPRWSPDLAGWSVLVATISWVIFGVLLVTRRFR